MSSFSSDESDENQPLDFPRVWNFLQQNVPNLSEHFTKQEVAKYSVIHAAFDTARAQDKRERKELRRRRKEEIEFQKHLVALSAFGVEGIGDDNMVLDTPQQDTGDTSIEGLQPYSAEQTRHQFKHQAPQRQLAERSSTMSKPALPSNSATDKEAEIFNSKEKADGQPEKTSAPSDANTGPEHSSTKSKPAAPSNPANYKQAKVFNSKKKANGQPVKTPAPHDAVFAKNIASQGGYYDEYTLRFPDFYPDGTHDRNICKVAGKEDTKPNLAWAHQTNNGWSRCYGVFQCPHFGQSNVNNPTDEGVSDSKHNDDGTKICWTRERPRIPRRGAKKDNDTFKHEASGKLIRPARRKCNIHNVDLVYVPCKAKWQIIDAGNEWKLHHVGGHNHAAPEASGPSQYGHHKIEELVRQNPQMTPIQLVAGRCGRQTTTPASELDPKGLHKGYVSKARADVLRSDFEKKTGAKSGLGPHHIDATFQYFRKHHTEEAELYVVKGTVAPVQAIQICSPTMCKLIKSAANPWQTDTVEGVVDPTYFKGEINITITSTWDNNQQSQVSSIG